MRSVVMVFVLIMGFLGAEDFNSTSVETQEKLLALCKDYKENELKKYKDNSLWNNREFVLEYASKCVFTLKFADKKFRDDREIVESAIKFNANWGYCYASKVLKKDRSLAKMATQRSIYAFKYLDPKFKDDKDIAMNGRGGLLQYLSPRLRKDKEVVAMAVKNSAKNLKYADAKFRNDKTFILEMINSEKDFTTEWDKQNWIKMLVKNLGKNLRKDKDIMVIAMKKNIDVLEFADDSLIDDKLFMLENIKKRGYLLKFASRRLKKDKELVLAAIDYNTEYLQYADEEIKRDMDFILKLRHYTNYDVMEYISKSLKDNKDFFSILFKKDKYKYYTSLDYTSERLKKDRDVVLLAVKHASSNIRYADKSFLSDREIVLLGITKNGSFLKYVDKKFFDDKEIITKAFDDNRESLHFASDTLKNDKIFMLKLVNDNGYAYEHIGNSLKKDKELALIGLEWDEKRLKDMDMIFRDDPQMVLKAMEQDTKYLQYASDRLRNSKEFIFSLMGYDAYPLKYATKEFRSNKKIMLEAIDKNVQSYKWMDESLKGDRDICLATVRKKGRLLYFLPKKFRSDKEVVKTAIQNDGFALSYASLALKKDKELIALAKKHSKLYDLIGKYPIERPHLDAWDSYYLDETLEMLYGKDANFTTSPKLIVNLNMEIKTDLKLKSIAILQDYPEEKNLIAWVDVHEANVVNFLTYLKDHGLSETKFIVVAEDVKGTLYINNQTLEEKRYGCGNQYQREQREYDIFFNAHLKRNITHENNTTHMNFMIVNSMNGYKVGSIPSFITNVRVEADGKTVFNIYTSEYLKRNPYFNIALPNVDKDAEIKIFCTDAHSAKEYEYKDNLSLRRKIVNPWKR